MFKDYYAILEIDVNASSEEIKTAFRNLAKKWHPDINPGIDTTQKMQDLNEANLILSDSEARGKYNIEYYRFKEIIKDKKIDYSEHQDSYNESSYEYSNYNIQDDLLKKWMENASRQAVGLAKKTIIELRELSKVGIQAAGNEMWKYLKAYIAVAIIFFIVFLFVKGCSQGNSSKQDSNVNQSIRIDTIKLPILPSNWKKYVTSEYSISYPPTWKLKLDKNVPGAVFYLIAPLETGQNTPMNVGLNVLIINGDSDNLDERVKNGIAELSRALTNFRIIKNIKVIENGIQCQQLIYTGSYNGYDTEDEQNGRMFKGKMYTLTFISDVNSFNTCQLTVEKILSSFLLKP